MNKLSKQQIKGLRFIETPEHGYLVVSRYTMNMFPEIKSQISEFSRIKNGKWFLEEDVDAPLFIHTLGIDLGKILTTLRVYLLKKRDE